MKFTFTKLCFVPILLCLYHTSFDQGLQKGDTFPSITFKAHYGDEPESLKLQDLGAKLVIIDFWNTRCGACIKAFPKVDSLQKVFGKAVQFVLVTPDAESVVAEFFKGHRRIKKPGVHFINADTILAKFFPHDFFPHHVWLAGGNTVFSIPDFLTSTYDNIRAFLDGGDISLKEDVKLPKVETNKPLLTSEIYNTHIPGISSYSYLSGSVDTALMIDLRQKKNGSMASNRILLNKVTPWFLYLTAYNAGYPRFNRRTVEFRVKDTLADKAFLYDLLVPPAKAKLLYEYMKADLQKTFGYQVSVEKRKTKCWAIRRASGDTLTAAMGKPGIHYGATGDSLWYFENVTTSTFTERFNMAFSSEATKLIDETGYIHPVNITISKFVVKPLDIELLGRELKKNHLELVPVECDIEFLVIKE